MSGYHCICAKCEGTIYGDLISVGDDDYCADCFLEARPWGCGGADELFSECLEPLADLLMELEIMPTNPAPLAYEAAL